ncbi:sensor histidine kinase [Namhaeicola litoreus]|uniref:histidine kinase n=1 Tax=Namhaeicola litoreus TaxID=1052145 RepID=A0ABW3Y0V4_9FLAO
MNQHLQTITKFIEQQEDMPDEQRSLLLKAVKDADYALTIAEFKLERTEKVKRTTAILLEETIEELEQKRKAIEQTNEALNKSLEELKATQTQLIQSEKMASLGELTAGIAHEIQNPLNFVNNFAEVSTELIDEIEEERHKKKEEKDEELVAEILADLKENLLKINHHGKRADAIVKGMLEHSRTNTGEKTLTDINALAEEFLKLSYHGLRAKDKSFNAAFEMELDPNLPKINVVAPDIGRVLLNLINNAFYAVNERGKTEEGYKPLVILKTKQVGNKLDIKVADNGTGISQNNIDKIFQPFFTTKPTGSGTGLGLSLSYDIVKAHGGEFKVQSKENIGSTFTIILPKK